MEKSAGGGSTMPLCAFASLHLCPLHSIICEYINKIQWFQKEIEIIDYPVLIHIRPPTKSQPAFVNVLAVCI